MTRVVLTSEAKEDVRVLDGAAKKVVLKAIKKLEDSPELRGEHLGSKASGNLTTFRKLVVGDRDYRVIYRVEDDGSVCVVWVVGRRVDSECYDLAVSRLRLYTANPALARDLQHLLDVAWDA